MVEKPILIAALLVLQSDGGWKIGFYDRCFLFKTCRWLKYWNSSFKTPSFILQSGDGSKTELNDSCSHFSILRYLRNHILQHMLPVFIFSLSKSQNCFFKIDLFFLIRFQSNLLTVLSVSQSDNIWTSEFCDNYFWFSIRRMLKIIHWFCKLVKVENSNLMTAVSLSQSDNVWTTEFYVNYFILFNLTIAENQNTFTRFSVWWLLKNWI